MAIVDKINKLIVKYGGTITGNAGTIEDKIDDLEKVVDAGGGSSGPLIATITNETYDDRLDKTWQEINDAFVNGTTVLVTWSFDSVWYYGLVVGVQQNSNGTRNVTFYDAYHNKLEVFGANTADGYPFVPVS